MSRLVVSDLRATVDGREILSGVSFAVSSGEVHAVMGPNGSGKSTLAHVMAGRPGYVVTGGSVAIDGVELLGLTPSERARAGLFLGMQYPIEVPGVSMTDVMVEALSAAGRPTDDVERRLAGEAAKVGLDPALLARSLNVDLSGGERKRSETVQLAVLEPRFALLDEIDSGLDVDALGQVSRRIEQLTSEGLGVVVITHYNRLLEELHADAVHVFAGGRIVESGGPELAARLEGSGYAEWAEFARDERPPRPVLDDPFADPLL